MERPLDLNLLRTFVAAAELGRVSSASELLGVPKSTVSRHISRLEEEMGAALFERKSDGLRLTTVGGRLFDRSRNAIHTLSGARSERVSLPRSGTIRIHAPTIYARGVLAPIVARYADIQPGISLEILLGDRYTVPDPNSVDLIVNVGSSPGRMFEIWSLGHVEAKLYASASLVAEKGAPASPAGLKSWPILTNDCSPGVRAKIRLTKGNNEHHAETGGARIVCGDPDILLVAALEGLGIARLPTFFADPKVRSGDLVEILPSYTADRHSVTLVRSHRNKNELARDFADFVSRNIV